MSLKLKTRLRVAAIAILAVFLLSLILARNATPDNPNLWGLKRIQEKVFLNLKSNPEERLDYMRGLLDVRLQELETQVKNQSYGYILPSATRYSTLAGQITEMVLANNMTDKVGSIKEQFNNHIKVLEEVYYIYPKNTDNEEYKYIEDDINYLKIYLDKLPKE